LVGEGHGPEVEHLLAAGAHRGDVLLVAGGRGHDNELPGGGVDLPCGAAHARIADARDERPRLSTAQPHRLRLATANALVAEVDVVVARRQRQTGPVPDADVLCAGAL